MANYFYLYILGLYSSQVIFANSVYSYLIYICFPLFCVYSVSKGIVDAHGGLLSVYSEGEGRGSTFTIELPIESPSVNNVQSLPDSTPSATTVSYSSRIRDIYSSLSCTRQSDIIPIYIRRIFSFTNISICTCCYPLWNRILPLTWTNNPAVSNQNNTNLNRISSIKEIDVEHSSHHQELVTPAVVTTRVIAKDCSNVNIDCEFKINRLSNSRKNSNKIMQEVIDEKEIEANDESAQAVSLVLSPHLQIQAIERNEGTSKIFPQLVVPDAGQTIMHQNRFTLTPFSRRIHMRTSVTADVKIEDELSFRSVGISSSNEPIIIDTLVKEQDTQKCANRLEHNNINIGEVEQVIFKYKKVLIVDDVAMNRKMLRRVLESRFDIVEEAGDGQEAVDMVRAAQIHGGDSLYDVITMDYQMPVMDGVTATRILRDLGYDGAIVAVTGNAFPADVQRFILSGANEVFIKPLDVKEFESFLASFFCRRL